MYIRVRFAHFRVITPRKPVNNPKFYFIVNLWHSVHLDHHGFITLLQFLCLLHVIQTDLNDCPHRSVMSSRSSALEHEIVPLSKSFFILQNSSASSSVPTTTLTHFTQCALWLWNSTRQTVYITVSMDPFTNGCLRANKVVLSFKINNWNVSG